MDSYFQGQAPGEWTKKMKMEIRGMEKLSFRERQVVALKETGKTNEQVQAAWFSQHSGNSLQSGPDQGL